MWLPLTHPLRGTWPITQAWTLPGNPTSDPLIHRLVLNPLNYTSKGWWWLFLSWASMMGTSGDPCLNTSNPARKWFQRKKKLVNSGKRVSHARIEWENILNVQMILLNAYCVLRTVLGSFTTLPHLLISKTQWEKNYYPHLVQECAEFLLLLWTLSPHKPWWHSICLIKVSKASKGTVKINHHRWQSTLILLSRA